MEVSEPDTHIETLAG